MKTIKNEFAWGTIEVPPPMPQVMKTMSEPFSKSRISFWFSSAERRPISGSCLIAS